MPCQVASETDKNGSTILFIPGVAFQFQSSIDVLASFYDQVLARKIVSMAMVDLQQLSDPSTGNLRFGRVGRATFLQKLLKPSKTMQKRLEVDGKSTVTEPADSSPNEENKDGQNRADGDADGDHDLLEGAKFLEEDIEVRGFCQSEFDGTDDADGCHDQGPESEQRLFEDLFLGSSLTGEEEVEAETELDQEGDQGAVGSSADDGQAQWANTSNKITLAAEDSEKAFLNASISRDSTFIGPKLEEKAAS